MNPISSKLRALQRSPHALPGLPLIFLASLVAGLAAIALNVAAHENFNRIFSLVIVVALTAPVFFIINRLTQSGLPDDSVSFEAVHRIRSTWTYLLNFDAAGRPEIKPPGAVNTPPQEDQLFNLDTFIRTADSVTGDLFIARLAESNRRLTLVLGEHGSGKSTLLLRLAVRLADDYLEHKVAEVPIVLGLREWTEVHSLRRWVVDQTIAAYALPPDVVNRWADRGNMIVLLDGLDEVAEPQRKRLIDALNNWSHSAEGTRLVVSCHISTPDVGLIVKSLRSDQLAIVRPLPKSDIRRYAQSALSGLARKSSPVTSRRLILLRKLLEEQITERETLRMPAMLDLLAATARNTSSTPGHDVISSVVEDPAAPALRLGNELLNSGDYEAAKGAYLAAARITGSSSRALSTTLYGACEALLGNEEAARTAVQESVAARLKESVAPVDPHMRRKSLTSDERRVLQVMSSEVSYDLSQISSMAGLTPSRVDAALLALKGIGAIESTNDKEDGTRYRLGDAFLVDA